MVEITQADREAAAQAAVLVEMRELILAGRADEHAEPWARHREPDWKPIKTAPRDIYMLCVVPPAPGEVKMHTAIFGSAPNWHPRIIIARRRRGDRPGRVREIYNGRGYDATHWMPLPELPE